MSIDNAELEGFELAYSVQIDSSQLLELMVDEIDTGTAFGSSRIPAGRS